MSVDTTYIITSQEFVGCSHISVIAVASFCLPILAIFLIKKIRLFFSLKFSWEQFKYSFYKYVLISDIYILSKQTWDKIMSGMWKKGSHGDMDQVCTSTHNW